MHPIFLKYWGHQLTLRSEDGSASNLALTLNDIRINPIPYQISAVSRALKALREHKGAILADEVGLGKTWKLYHISAIIQPVRGREAEKSFQQERSGARTAGNGRDTRAAKQTGSPESAPLLLHGQKPIL